MIAPVIAVVVIAVPDVTVVIIAPELDTRVKLFGPVVTKLVPVIDTVIGLMHTPVAGVIAVIVGAAYTSPANKNRASARAARKKYLIKLLLSKMTPV